MDTDDVMTLRSYDWENKTLLQWGLWSPALDNVGIIFIRSRDFDKTLKLSFSKSSGHQIWVIRSVRSQLNLD